jgi:hypothetical protein
MLSKWAGSGFTYSPNYDLQGLVLNDAASATSIGNLTRAHRKLDNTGYSYAGRSYGVASSVGLVDQTGNTTAILDYRYNETGYLSDVSCIVNSTSDWALYGPMYASDDLTYPNLYLAYGTLPNGNPEVYSACGLGHSKGIFALVGSSRNGLNVFSIAAGKNYAALNQVQCSVIFTPTVFSIAVNTTNGLTAVTPLPGSSTKADVSDIEPTGFITSFAMRMPTSISQQHTCDLYTSLVGSTFVQNIQNVHPDFRAAGGNDSATLTADVLRGVEDSLVSMLDNSLLAFSSAQLTIANDTFSTPVSLSLRAVRIGEPIYVYIIVGIHVTVTLLCLIEFIRTRMWKGLSKFDYTDIKSAIVGASLGGNTIAERVRKSHMRRQSWWTADSRDTVVGDIRVKLKSGGRDIKLVGVGMEDGEFEESPLV